MITLKQLLEIMPLAKGRADPFIGPLNSAMAEFGINTPERQAAFLAQIAHESEQLSCLSENLDYSAEGLATTWPHLFAAKSSNGVPLRYRSSGEFAPNIDARTLHRRPQAIANFVYANRLGNGAASTGDGWLYRGAGLIQLTGKDNQHACAERFGVDSAAVGDWLRTPVGACKSAAWFWQQHGCNELADAGDFDAITRKINGGQNGAINRQKYWARAKGVLCPA